jgi:DNA-directed RNA polymerase beta' subunit
MQAFWSSFCAYKRLGTDWKPDDKETKFKLPVAIRAITPASNLETDESKVSTLAQLAKYLKTLGKCSWCGAECDMTKRVGNGFTMRRTGASLTGQQIFNIFKDIRHEDCLFMRLGDNVRPEWFLFYCLDVVRTFLRKSFTKKPITVKEIKVQYKQA